MKGHAGSNDDSRACYIPSHMSDDKVESGGNMLMSIYTLNFSFPFNIEGLHSGKIRPLMQHVGLAMMGPRPGGAIAARYGNGLKKRDDQSYYW
jgi:hypothetical protein